MLIPRFLKPLWKICPEYDARYAMKCIRAERDAEGVATLTVTDGRILVAARLDAEDSFASEKIELPGVTLQRPGFACNIPRDLWRLAFETCRSETDPRALVLDEADDTVRIMALNQQGACTTGKPQEGKFPDWREIVNAKPRDKVDIEANKGRVVRSAVSPRVFGAVCEVLDRMGFETIEFEITVDGLAPWRWAARTEQATVFGALMPRG